MADTGGVDAPAHARSAPGVDGHGAAVEKERHCWGALDPPTLTADLKAVIAGAQTAMPETLVYLCQRAHDEHERKVLNLAFEALSKRTTPLLSSFAWGSTKEDRKDVVQDILVSILTAIRNGKAAFAQERFASFAKRASISLYRKHRARFEGANTRVEPTADQDPLDALPDRLASPEAKAALARALDKLSTRQRTVFIQRHILGMAQQEMADHHGVDVRTIRSWLKAAATVVGLQGDDK